MKIFNEGERVCSTLMGFYSGLPGTIIRAAQAQYDIFDNDNKYVIELDIGRTTKKEVYAKHGVKTDKQIEEEAAYKKYARQLETISN